MGLFKRTGSTDRQEEFDLGCAAVERDDINSLLEHCVRLLCDDRSNPDGWILRTALQLHSVDFDLEKASKNQGGLFFKASVTTYCEDPLNDACGSYKMAIGYCDDESRLQAYAYIIGHSMAYDLAHACRSESGLENRYIIAIAGMLEETDSKFGHDCSAAFYGRLIAGYEQFMSITDMSKCINDEGVRSVLAVLREMKGDPSDCAPFNGVEEHDDFFDDEDRMVTLSVIRGKSCADYQVGIYLDGKPIIETDNDDPSMVKIIAGDYELRIAAEGPDSLSVSDTVSIWDDSVLKIKIAHGELRYALDED